MSTLLWIVVGVVVLAGALLLARAWLLRAGPDLTARSAPPISPAWMAGGAGAGDVVTVRLAREDLKLIQAEIQGLHGIRDDIQRVADLLQQGLSGALAAEQAHVSPPRTEPYGGSARDVFAEQSRTYSPVPSGAWPPKADNQDPGVHRDDGGRGFNVVRNAYAADPASSAPAAPQPHVPSSAAVPVEAKDDVVVSSERYPPEAWLERRGGEGEVWLNAGVTLSDAGLQRWSTFFDWERREPGARYQATRPATVTSSGSLVSKGAARPL